MADMQGRSVLPLLQGQTPADWRAAMYYRYYHYPQHHRVQRTTASAASATS